MSRANTLGSMATLEPIPTTSSAAELAMYGGTCKYACLIREHGPKKNLQAQNHGLYGVSWVLQCKSTKCRFGKPALNPKNRDEVDERVYRSRSGIEYRWIFLAKSHASQDKVTSKWPFVCLICQLLHHDPTRYYGHEELFSHIAEHQEDSVDGTPLEGPLTFSNRGIKTAALFDLNLPDRQQAPQRRPPAQAIQDEGELQRKLEEMQNHRNSKASSLESRSNRANRGKLHVSAH